MLACCYRRKKMRFRLLRRGRTMLSCACVLLIMAMACLVFQPTHVRRHHTQQEYNAYIGILVGLLRWATGTEHHVFGAVMRLTVGNYEPVRYSRLHEETHGGQGVKNEPWEKDAIDRSIITYSFNQYSSDKISFDRTIPDLRRDECKHWHYPEQLSSASVVIAFHNEGWSTLIRTIHSVINRTPPSLLTEIILVDDASTMEHLRTQLDMEILKTEYRHVVKLLRNTEREGVIASRVLGAEMASGQTIVMLDAHCEVGLNWLPPLLSVIKANRSTVAVPILDIIDSINFMVYPQSRGALARGIFDWNLDYKRVGRLPNKETNGRRYETEPYRSPVLAGGVLAVDRTYFLDIGAYDSGLELWGGDNYELSFKVWMCGGSLVWVPCSRVGHMYRINGRPPYGFSKGSFQSIRDKNYARVAEVWMDDYKQYFYAKRSYLHGSRMQLGDLTKQREFRTQHNCKSFQWFLEEVASDVIQHFPLPPLPIKSGEIRTYDANVCMDTKGLRYNADGGRVGLFKCHGQGGNQFFHLTTKGDIRVNDNCLCESQNAVILCPCDNDDVIRDWDVDVGRHTISRGQFQLCLTRSVMDVSLTRCIRGRRDQMWRFINYAI